MERPAERALLDGIRAYDDGQYAQAEKALRKALADGLQSARDRATRAQAAGLHHLHQRPPGRLRGAVPRRPRRRCRLCAEPLRSRPPGVGPGVQEPVAVAPRRAAACRGVAHNRPRRCTTPDRTARTATVPPPAARVLGRHRRRRRGVLCQLPEVLRARAHRMAAHAGLRRSSSCCATTGAIFVVTDTALRYLRAGAAGRPARRHGRTCAEAGRASMTLAQQAWRGGDTAGRRRDPHRLRRRTEPSGPAAFPAAILENTRNEPGPVDHHAGAAGQPRGAARHGRADDRLAGQLDGDLRQALRPEARAPAATTSSSASSGPAAA